MQASTDPELTVLANALDARGFVVQSRGDGLLVWNEGTERADGVSVSGYHVHVCTSDSGPTAGRLIAYPKSGNAGRQRILIRPGDLADPPDGYDHDEAMGGVHEFADLVAFCHAFFEQEDIDVSDEKVEYLDEHMDAIRAAIQAAVADEWDPKDIFDCELSEFFALPLERMEDKVREAEDSGLLTLDD